MFLVEPCFTGNLTNIFLSMIVLFKGITALLLWTVLTNQRQTYFKNWFYLRVFKMFPFYLFSAFICQYIHLNLHYLFIYKPFVKPTHKLLFLAWSNRLNIKTNLIWYTTLRYVSFSFDVWYQNVCFWKTNLKTNWSMSVAITFALIAFRQTKLMINIFNRNSILIYYVCQVILIAIQFCSVMKL